MFRIPLVNACLSPLVVIPPGESMRHMVAVRGAAPGGVMGPEFRTPDVEATYRLVWTSLVFRYDDGRPGFGAPVPEPR